MVRGMPRTMRNRFEVNVPWMGRGRWPHGGEHRTFEHRQVEIQKARPRRRVRGGCRWVFGVMCVAGRQR